MEEFEFERREVDPTLTAAAELFESCGYWTTIEQVASRAGVEAAIVRRRYGTIAAVEAALVDTLHGLLVATVLVRTPKPSEVGGIAAGMTDRSLADRLWVWVDAIRDSAREHPAVVRYALAARRSPWLAREVQAGAHRLREVFALHLGRPGLSDVGAARVFDSLALFMLGRLTHRGSSEELSESDEVGMLVALIHALERRDAARAGGPEVGEANGPR